MGGRGRRPAGRDDHGHPESMMQSYDMAFQGRVVRPCALDAQHRDGLWSKLGVHALCELERPPVHGRGRHSPSGRSDGRRRRPAAPSTPVGQWRLSLNFALGRKPPLQAPTCTPAMAPLPAVRPTRAIRPEETFSLPGLMPLSRTTSAQTRRPSRCRPGTVERRESTRRRLCGSWLRSENMAVIRTFVCRMLALGQFSKPGLWRLCRGT
jgi:hypothetical protein